MLTSLLPGLRHLRTPLAIGYLYAALVFLWFGPERLAPTQPRNDLQQRLADLVDLTGPGTALAAVSFAAYLVGSVLVIRRPPAILRRIAASLPARNKDWDPRAFELDSWAEEQSAMLNAKGWTGKALVSHADTSLGFKRALHDYYDHLFLDEDPEFDHMTEQELEEEKTRRALPSAFKAVAQSEHDVLVTRLQIERESLFNEYDRLGSEAELRFSLFPPLVLLSITAGFMWSWWAAVGLVIPLVLVVQAVRLQASADSRVRQAMLHGVVECPSVKQLRELPSERRVRAVGSSDLRRSPDES